METTFEDYLRNHGQTIDFQIIPDKSRFCIFPTPQPESNKQHAVFGISGNSLQFNGYENPDEIGQQVRLEPEAVQISHSTTMEQYLAMYPSGLRLRFDTTGEEPLFYIHPINENGETLTFKIVGNAVNLTSHPIIPTSSATQEEQRENGDENEEN